MQEQYENQIRDYLKLLGNDVFELRIFCKDRYSLIDGNRIYTGKICRGYYDHDHITDVIEEIQRFNGAATGFFTTIQACKKELLGRSYNKLEYSVESDDSTKDVDITHFSLFPIDVDIKRASGISATRDEIDRGYEKRNEILRFLEDHGIQPIKAFSGNGYHLLIPINPMEATDENRIRFKDTGDIVCSAFGGDQSVYNPGRIWKLYGTKVCKGDDAPEIGRVHRYSKIDLPDTITRYDFEEIEDAARTLVSKENLEKKKEPSSRETEQNYVDIFIEQHGIKVLKIKEDPEKISHSVQCPFCNNSDGSAIFDNNDGPIGYTCQHDSCVDKKWKDFKEHYTGPIVQESMEEESADGIPIISVTKTLEDGTVVDRASREVVKDIRKILENREPDDELFFVRNGNIGFLRKKKEKVRITKDYSYNETKLIFKPITSKQMRPIINEVANFKKSVWVKQKDSEGDGFFKDQPVKSVDTNVAEDVFSMVDLENLPWIHQFLSRPLINKEFNLINEGGYHSEDGIYLDPERIVNIDEELSLEDAHNIIEEWLQDFKFLSDADRANVIALGLTLMLRSALPYGALPPLFLITSSNPGSGKSTLANIIGIVASGQAVGSTSISNSEEEMRKHLTAEAMLGTEFVIFDNAKTQNTIDCGSLASAVTEARVRGRELGKSNIISEQNNLTVCFTGNKVTASPELVDRAIFIELNSNKRAADRKFQTKTIIADTIEKRDTLYSAFYTFFKSWKDAGAVELEDTNHRQQQWEAIIGGILNHIAAELDLDYYGTFGDNYADHKKKSDPEWMAITEFMYIVVNQFGSDSWTVSDIMQIASYEKDRDGESGENILGLHFQNHNDNTQRAANLGRFLTMRVEDKVFGSKDNEYKLAVAPDRKDHKKAYFFMKNEPDPEEKTDEVPF